MTHAELITAIAERLIFDPTRQGYRDPVTDRCAYGNWESDEPIYRALVGDAVLTATMQTDPAFRREHGYRYRLDVVPGGHWLREADYAALPADWQAECVDEWLASAAPGAADA